MGSHFTGGFQLVNGWNNVEDNNSGKTIGLTGVFTGKKATWSNVYYTGPENTATNKGWRNLYDTNLLLTPTDKFNAYINFDYGSNKDAVGNGKSTWKGLAAAAKFQATSMFALTPRIEFFDDTNGFSTGTPQTAKEFTLTAEVKMKEGMFTRFEYRHDWSDQQFFERGATGHTDHQDTLLVGIVAFFGPKR
jgi:predicted porin